MPRRVLARGAAAEVLAGHQDAGALIAWIVQHKIWIGFAVGVEAPVKKEKFAEAGALDALQELLGDDLVGVDIGAIERRHQCRYEFEMAASACYSQSRMSMKCPATAAAAAIAGLTRCVRPPRPWRPSKLRLLVEAQRSPGSRMSGFMPRHIEQPGSRQSKPASVKDLVQAFLLGLRLHLLRTRHDHRAARVGLTVIALRDLGGGAQIFDARSWCRSR